MTGPGWLAGLLAAIMLATAAYCVSRLVIARIGHRPVERDADATHAVMGVAMAGMLTAGLRSLPSGAWALVFAAAAAWFTWRLAGRTLAGQAAPGRPLSASGQRGHDAPIVLMCLAMIYMLLAATSATAGRAGAQLAMGGAGASGGGAHFGLLTLLLAVALGGYAIWAIDHLPALARVAELRLAALAPALVMARASPGREGTPADLPTAARRGESGSAGVPLSPRLAACCQIAMSVTMAYMLVLML